ncbi:unnamed protein product [Oikopleura dioica]|uniref:Uncharacterized protein n=1 Tax=Oikopleura dioica TaxID=34765 RepID=E4WXX3_OIKDI|nr:unnamed protein product [Oikopleura dioica]
MKGRVQLSSKNNFKQEEKRDTRQEKNDSRKFHNLKNPKSGENHGRSTKDTKFHFTAKSVYSRFRKTEF